MAASAAGRLSAASRSRARWKIVALPPSEIDKEMPCRKRTKSLTLTAPISSASRPAAPVTQGKLPTTRNRLSQAAMKAKYISPEKATNTPPISAIRRRFD